MYGCSIVVIIVVNLFSFGEVDSGDLVDLVREWVVELFGLDFISSMDLSDIDEDFGYRVKLIYFFFCGVFVFFCDVFVVLCKWCSSFWLILYI